MICTSSVVPVAACRSGRSGRVTFGLFSRKMQGQTGPSGPGSKGKTPADEGDHGGEDKEEVSGRGHQEEEKEKELSEEGGSKATFDPGQPSSSGGKREAERSVSDETRVGLKQVLVEQSLGDNVSSGSSEKRLQPIAPPARSLDEIWTSIVAAESNTDHRFGFRFSEGPSRLEMQRRAAAQAPIHQEPSIEVPPPAPVPKRRPTIRPRPRTSPKSESTYTKGESSQSSAFATGEDTTRESSQFTDQPGEKKVGQSRVEGEPRDGNSVQGVGDLPPGFGSMEIVNVDDDDPAECQEPSSSEQYDASKGKTVEFENPNISSQERSSRSEVETDLKPNIVGDEVVDSKTSSQDASSSSKDSNDSKEEIVAIDVTDAKIPPQEASSSTEDDNDSKTKAVATEVVDPKTSPQEASSSSKDDNTSKAKIPALEVLNPKTSSQYATTSHEESVSVSTGEASGSHQVSTGEASGSHQGNVQECPQVLVPPRVHRRLSNISEDYESLSLPGNISDDEIPAWRRKLIKVVSICCFCNTTNQP